MRDFQKVIKEKASPWNKDTPFAKEEEIMFCEKCGKESKVDAKICLECGAELKNKQIEQSAQATKKNSPSAPVQTAAEMPPLHHTTVNVQTTAIVQKNGLGTAGFVLALIGLFLSWVPILGWIIWFLGAALSVAGIFRVPKGMAIAGTVISFIGLIILIMAVGLGTSLFAAMG